MDSFTWPDWATLKWVGPGVRPTLPPASFFRFPPSPQPAVLIPPSSNPTLAHPFTISTEWYNKLLEPIIPITVALVYVSLITFLNSVNKNRKYEPWAISKSNFFKLFVLLHNVVLALYSGWTFIGMVNDLRLSIESPRGPYGLAGTVDSFCKMHGPRGLGAAATYNATTNSWGMTNHIYHLAKDTLLPDSTDVGRVWNEGLAFYGWLFYLSKYYEVIDTLIIIAKGKKSSFLQTYHHAGAMLSMWAGIRYMSPPIWMFVFVNSFIHTIMYTFYFITALGNRIPKPIKRTLTTLQITQFVVGVVFAFSHLFVKYQVPVSTPYIYHLGDTVKSIASSISSDASSVVAAATATAFADRSSWLKKLALRAAGREGLAENVWNKQGQTFGHDAAHAVKDYTRREETRYREHLEWVHCLDTSGQAFAIYLNILYLLPLTWLFARFFIKAYLERAEQRRRSSLDDVARNTKESFTDARKKVSRRLSQAFENYQGTNGSGNGGANDDSAVIDGEELKKEIKKIGDNVKSAGNKAVKKGKETGNNISEKVSQVDTEKIKKNVQDDVQKVKQQAKAGSNKVSELASDAAPSEETKQKVKETAGQAQKKVQEGAAQAKDVAVDVAGSAKEIAQDAQAKTGRTAEEISSQLSKAYQESTSEETKEKVVEAWSTIKEDLDWASQSAMNIADEAMQSVFEAGKSIQSSPEKKVSEVKEEAGNEEGWIQSPSKKSKKKANQVKDTAGEKANQAAEQVKSTAQNVKSSASKKTEQSSSSTSKSTSSGTTQSSSKHQSNAPSKKEEDKIIDQSQLVRDEDVDVKAESPTNDLSSSYAEVAADGVDEGEKVDIKKSEGEDTNIKFNDNDKPQHKSKAVDDSNKNPPPTSDLPRSPYQEESSKTASAKSSPPNIEVVQSKPQPDVHSTSETQSPKDSVSEPKSDGSSTIWMPEQKSSVPESEQSPSKPKSEEPSNQSESEVSLNKEDSNIQLPEADSISINPDTKPDSSQSESIQTPPPPQPPSLTRTHSKSSSLSQPTSGRIRRASSAFKVEFFPRSPTTTTSLHTSSADRHPTPSPTISRTNTSNDLPTTLSQSTGDLKEDTQSDHPNLTQSWSDISTSTRSTTSESSPHKDHRGSPRIPRRNTGEIIDIDSPMQVDTKMRVDPSFRVDTEMKVDPNRRVDRFDTTTSRKLNSITGDGGSGRRTPSPVKKNQTGIPAPVKISKGDVVTGGDAKDKNGEGNNQIGDKSTVGLGIASSVLSSPVKGRQWHSRRRGVKDGGDGSMPTTPVKGNGSATENDKDNNKNRDDVESPTKSPTRRS